VHLRELDSADDRAALLDWRLPDAGPVPPGRCHGCPAYQTGLPTTRCGPYLKARADLIANLADQLRMQAELKRPPWTAIPAPLLQV
jgi:hypothetical protein